MKVLVTHRNGDKNIVEVDCTREELEDINNNGCPDTRDAETDCAYCALNDVICFRDQPTLEEVEVVPTLVAPMAGEVTIEPKKAYKVWAHVTLEKEELEDFSREHEVLQVDSNVIGHFLVFYVKEEGV